MLIETIRVENGTYCYPESHLLRMERSARQLFGTSSPLPQLPPVPEQWRKGVVKCRILYSQKVESIEYLPYEPRLIRSLRLVEGGQIDYHLKYADRQPLEDLRVLRNGCDEVIILRDGQVTDTSYSNLLLLSDIGIFTPAVSLLAGVMRQRLIEQGIAKPLYITGQELVSGAHGIHSVMLINAMLPPGTIPAIPIGSIRNQCPFSI